MDGFSAITNANGWLIAALGISIVFFGLASLAFLILHFPRVIGWWNAQAPETLAARVKRLFSFGERAMPATTTSGDSLVPAKLDDAEEALRLLSAHMGEPFQLPRLLELAEHRGLGKPHSTINRLLLRGAIVGGQDGLFRWAKSSQDTPPPNRDNGSGNSL